MRELPDRLTERVWQMLAAARTSAMSREKASAQAMFFLRSNLRSLARRAHRGRQTRYAEALKHDLEALARLIVVLDQEASWHESI